MTAPLYASSYGGSGGVLLQIQAEVCVCVGLSVKPILVSGDRPVAGGSLLKGWALRELFAEVMHRARNPPPRVVFLEGGGGSDNEARRHVSVGGGGGFFVLLERT